MLRRRKPTSAHTGTKKRSRLTTLAAARLAATFRSRQSHRIMESSGWLDLPRSTRPDTNRLIYFFPHGFEVPLHLFQGAPERDDSAVPRRITLHCAAFQPPL